jgi:FixJ family two-component response regulator
VVYLLTSAKSSKSAVPPSGSGSIGLVVRTKRRLIAIVDDDEYVREAISGLMRSLGFAAETFSSAKEFLSSSQVGRTACLIADVQMPETSGLDLYFQLSKLGRTIPTILITAYPTESDRARAHDAGIISYLAKPFAEADLLDGVRAALAQDSSNDHP